MNNHTRYLIMDVDGTLTDGKIYMGENGEVMKAFDIKDGYGIHDVLIKFGITPVIITGRTSKIVANRCKELGINNLFQGEKDKLAVLNGFLNDNDGVMSQVAYIGDDLNDYACMAAVRNSNGLTGCPADAHTAIRNISGFISSHNGGDGAVRDFIDYIVSL